MKFKRYLKTDLIYLQIEKANKKFPNKLSSGNCGMFAFGLAKYLIDEKIFPFAKIALICKDNNENSEDDLLNGEPTIYHVVVQIENFLFDESGLTSKRNLLKFSIVEYGDKNPLFWSELNVDEKIRKIISFNTNWDISWEIFYRFFRGNKI